LCRRVAWGIPFWDLRLGELFFGFVEYWVRIDGILEHVS